VGLEAREQVHVGGAEEFEIPLKPAAMRQVFASVQEQDKLITTLPELGKISQVKVQISSGLLGAALNAAAVLVSYPFGCTEQLVHSTIPNLVLMDLTRRAGIEPKDLGPLAEALTKAEKNAALGIQRIIRNQKTDGGFGLWPSDPSSSLPVTVVAVYALKFARELKIEGAEGSFHKGMEYLYRRSTEQNEERRGTLSGYELARIAEISWGSQPFRQQIAYVEGVYGDASAPASHLIDALKIFAATRQQTWNRFNQRFKDTPVKTELITRLQKTLDRFDPDVYLKAARAEAGLFESLGFGFGAPYVVSAGMGVLADLEALPPELETKLKQILIYSMRNGFWISTFDTAQVILNLRELLSKEAYAVASEEEAAPRKLVVRDREGRPLGELTRIPSGFVGSFAEPGPPGSISALQLDGLDPAEAAYATVTADVPFAAVAPHSHGVVVKRKFLRITAGGSEPLDLAQPLHKGDLVVTEIYVRRAVAEDAPVLPSQFLVVEDGVPSLAQAIDDDQTYLADSNVQPQDETYWGSIKETQRYPEKTVRIARVLGKGEIRVYQVWQVAFTGKATIPPARAFDMYDESLQGNTEAQSVRSE
jgi:hypothetical protein